MNLNPDKSFLPRRSSGFNLIDTAGAYVNSEERLGRNDLSGFKFITKVQVKPAGHILNFSEIKSSVLNSLRNLGISKCEAILIHDGQNLYSNEISKLNDFFMELRDEGLCEKVGISVYEPKHLVSLTKDFSFDLVQLPGNIFDQRIEENGFIDYCLSKGISIHIRSLFLQGLLLLERHEIPPQFLIWKKLFQNWFNYLDYTGMSAIEACLSYGNYLVEKGVDHLVVGAHSSQQIHEILDKSMIHANPAPLCCSCGDEKLILPHNWEIK